MTLAQLESAQKRMQQKWYDLAMAEQRGVALPVLERMCESSPGAVKRKKAAGLKGNATPVDGSQNRMAS